MQQFLSFKVVSDDMCGNVFSDSLRMFYFLHVNLAMYACLDFKMCFVVKWKYYDEHVCVCVFVCLSARISPEPHARSLPNFCGCCL